MSPAKWTASLILSLTAIAAQPPLPDLRVEATTGGSVLYVRNTSSQPLTAFVIELVGYPGSSWAHAQDSLRDPIPAGGEKRIPVTSMTVGAVPEYVKMQAAIYEDGTSAGVPQKVAPIIDRRRAELETTRELIRRLQAGEDQATVTAGMKEWVASLSRPGQNDRKGSPSVNRLAAMNVIARAATDLETRSVEQTVAALSESERLLAASKPPLQ